MNEYQHNAFVVVNGHPAVHLRYHVSQVFFIDMKRYGYLYGECPFETFAAAAAKKGFTCKLTEDGGVYAISDADPDRQIYINTQGEVFIDGERYTIEEDNAANRTQYELSSNEGTNIYDAMTKIPSVIPQKIPRKETS